MKVKSASHSVLFGSSLDAQQRWLPAANLGSAAQGNLELEGSRQVCRPSLQTEETETRPLPAMGSDTEPGSDGA